MRHDSEAEFGYIQPDDIIIAVQRTTNTFLPVCYKHPDLGYFVGRQVSKYWFVLHIYCSHHDLTH